MERAPDVNANLQEDAAVAAAEECETDEKKKKSPFPGFGIFCALISSLVYSFNALIVKLIDLHPMQLSLSRCYVQFLILLPLIHYKHHAGKVDVLGPKNLKRFLWLRGLVGSCAMILLYLAVDALSLGNAITITYLNIILVPFFARIFLKESLRVTDLLFALLSLTGVVLIAQPTFIFPIPEGGKPQSVVGILFAIGCATCQATSFIVIRKLGRETYPPLNVLYYSACGSVITTLILFLLKEFQLPCKLDVPYILLLGVLGILGQFFITLALQAERAGTVGILRTVQIIIVYTLQVTILGDVPTVLSIVGAALIFSSSLGIGFRKIFYERIKRQSTSNN